MATFVCGFGLLILFGGALSQEVSLNLPVAKDECAANIDLIILVDGSQSVTQRNFILVKDWIKNLAKSFDIESGNVQIGVVQYSYWNSRRPMWRQNYIKTEIRLGQYKSIESFSRAVDRMRYQGYQTFTAHALMKIVDYDFKGRNSRYPEAQRAIILLTDGKATDARDLQSAVEHAESEGKAAIFAVGVGDYSIDELRLITREDRGRIFELQNFGQLETIAHELPGVLRGSCNCFPTGSIGKDCDICTKQCYCKRNVIGKRCDQCEDGTYNISNSGGCVNCRCNQVGTKDGVQCDKVTGRCDCLPGVVGEKCDRCHEGRYGFPDCKVCDCGGFAEKCDEVTGICIICKENRGGDHCERCRSGFYMLNGLCVQCQCNGKIEVQDPDACDRNTGECLKCLDNTAGFNCEVCQEYTYRDNLTGSCQSCQCDLIGTEASTCAEGRCSCNDVTGQCICKQGSTGLSCSYCAEGYWDHQSGVGCLECGCHPDGSSSQSCDKETGQCLCLPGNTGRQCNKCSLGFFRQNDALGCEACQCVIVGTNVSHCDGDTCSCDDVGQCICLPNVEGLKCDQCRVGYWGIGSEGGCKPCSCDKAGSFGESCDKESGKCECLPNHTGAKCDQCNRGYYRQTDFETCRECGCNRDGTVENTCDKDNCECDSQSGRCQCRPNVIGIVCDECEEGFWNFGVLEGCRPCRCHSSGSSSRTCDKFTGQCRCNPGYGGMRCHQCLPGHARLNGTLECSECQCDLSGTNSSSCDLGVCTCDTVTGQCPCLPNVVGLDCSECSDGYWDIGHPDGCQACQCHALGSMLQSCDKTTGDCRCLPGHMGPKCKQCEKGYSRKHVGEKCKACKCDEFGTNQSFCDNGFCACDSITGKCPCSPGVAGLLCDRCEDEFWGLSPENGCTACECSERGSSSLACNKKTGKCQCLQGHTGDKCDKCDHGYFRTAPQDLCSECKCDIYGCGGSDCNCDPSTGQCECMPHVTGLKCDKCVDGYWNIRSMTGCKPCKCVEIGSISSFCEEKSGQCRCATGYAGTRCHTCAKDYSRDEVQGICKSDLLGDQRNPLTTTTIGEPSTLSTPRPSSTPGSIRYVRPTPAPYKHGTTTYSRCRSCMKWPSYCYGWMCRRRWPYHQFKPSRRRCNYGHKSCQYNVANGYGYYGSRRRTSSSTRTQAASRPLYGYSLYGNSGFDYKYYSHRTAGTRSRAHSSRSRSVPVSYGLYRSLYGKWK